MRALVLLTALALPAHAEPGFFRDPGDRVMEANVLKSSSVCTVTVKYDTLTPQAVELSGLTVACYPTMYQALLSASGKIFVLGEPAKPYNYECAVQVAWDPANPFTSINTLTGDTACAFRKSIALGSAAAFVKQTGG